MRSRDYPQEGGRYEERQRHAMRGWGGDDGRDARNRDDEPGRYIESGRWNPEGENRRMAGERAPWDQGGWERDDGDSPAYRQAGGHGFEPSSQRRQSSRSFGQGAYVPDSDEISPGFRPPSATRGYQSGEHTQRQGGYGYGQGDHGDSGRYAWRGGYSRGSDRAEPWDNERRSSYEQGGGYYGLGAFVPGSGRQDTPGRGSYGSGGAGYEPSTRRHHGRPPKGYVRSDERIKEQLCEHLMEDPQVDAGDVSISVSNGRVTLEGTVDSRRMKFLIEDEAENCGAKDVQNNLRVSSAGDSQSSDSSARGGDSMASSTKPDTSGDSGRTSRKT